MTFGDMWVKASAPTVSRARSPSASRTRARRPTASRSSRRRPRSTAAWSTTPPFVVKGADLSGGGSATVSADLKPGKYELICHLAGHYAAGQTTPFEVALAEVQATAPRRRSH